MISGSRNIFLDSLLVELLVEDGKGDQGVGERHNLLIFHTKILLCELAREFDQDPMGPALRVPEQGYYDVTVAEVEDCLGLVSRESS